jgi:hypothetical protein
MVEVSAAVPIVQAAVSLGNLFQHSIAAKVCDFSKRGDSQSSRLATTTHCVRLRTENVRKGMEIEPLTETSPSIIRMAGIPGMRSHHGDSCII